MKFSNLVLTLIVIASFSSCSKEKMPSPQSSTPVVNTTEAVMKFNGNLTDSCGKTGVEGIVGIPAYVSDRHGNPGNALYLNGASQVRYNNVSFKGQAMTMAAWVKYDNVGGGLEHIVDAYNAKGQGVSFIQSEDKFGGLISTPSTNGIFGNIVDANWHHLAATYDGKDIKVYMDGVFAASTNHPGSIGGEARSVVIGAFMGDFWKGAIDDLRIYSKVMTENEISKLFTIQ
jgi:hypothetical protein